MSTIADNSLQALKTAGMLRMRINLYGILQGIGLRPFLYRLARTLDLGGWVRNTAQGLEVEIEGPASLIEHFIFLLQEDLPPPARLDRIEMSSLPPVGSESFKIRDSEIASSPQIVSLPDLATCAECLSELFDSENRRYRYPFINCTGCGPRFTIVQALPYDRSRTSMKAFPLCEECRLEYETPEDRRFHAQPNACPACGPQVELWDSAGTVLSRKEEALTRTSELIRDGRIVAVKGVGGYHLFADASNADAVTLLRKRKQRPDKPLALLFPALDMVRQICHVSTLEETWLTSAAAPIVLLQRKAASGGVFIAETVAPGIPQLGIMLPSNPLHHVLMQDLARPVVATSGNVADGVICIDERQALEQLRGIADAFLVHNRPILQHADDSIVHLVAEREQVLRRSRGYTPWPIALPDGEFRHLALGGHLKNTIAFEHRGEAVLSQHLGDLATDATRDVFEQRVQSIIGSSVKKPDAILCDAHPDYHSTRYGAEVGVPVRFVQHHVAHVFSCMADNEVLPPVLGVAWDGAGYGPDGTLWGGEFFKVTANEIHRFASLRPFPLPGGEQAMKEPRRSLLGLLHELEGDACFQRSQIQKTFLDKERNLLQQSLAKGVNTPRTSSMGRLFDAVASLLGLRHVASFEGQAAMELQFRGQPSLAVEPYPVSLTLVQSEGSPAAGEFEHWKPEICIDWAPWILALLDDIASGVSVEVMATRFHRTLAATVAEIAGRVGIPEVVLSGGCFQNRMLTEMTVAALKNEKFIPNWHRQVPPNDGGLSFGQLAYAAWLKQRESA